MKLSKLERLMLVNQYLILEKIDPENENDYKIFRKALENGYEYHYDDAINWFSEDFPEEESNFVIDVLDMYRQITFSYRNAVEKEGLEDSRIKFPGFDGNNESEYLGYTEFFVIDLGRFTELKESKEFGNFNSHRRMKEKYRRMLSVWESTNDKFNLTISDIKSILNA